MAALSNVSIQSSNLTLLSSPVNESIGGALPCRYTNGSVSGAGGTPLITDGLNPSESVYNTGLAEYDSVCGVQQLVTVPLL